MHLAVLAATVFSSHSATLYALDELVQRGVVPADLPARYVDALPDTLKSGNRSPEADIPSPAAQEPPAPPVKTTPPLAAKSASAKSTVATKAATAKPATKSSALTAKARSAGA
jgi:hypothetical protein